MSARQTLLDSTMDLMRRRGVAGASINALLEHSGVARRTVYLKFPGGKGELVTAATRYFGTVSSGLIAMWDTDQPPAVSVNAFVAWWRHVLEQTDFDAGCPIVAAALGRSEVPEAADAAREVFDDWQRIIAERLVGHGLAPALARSLAITMVAAVEGAIVLSLAERTTEPLDLVAGHVVELIDLHLADARGR